MKILTEMISISTFLISFTFIYGGLIRYTHFKSPVVEGIIHGLAFSAISIIGMLIPVELLPGVIVDGRTVIISLSAIFGGVIPCIITTLSTSLYRIYLGGAGLTAGLASIALALLNGLFFRYVYRLKVIKRDFLFFLLLGLGNAFLGTLMIFILPSWEIIVDVLKRLTLPIHIFFPSIALFLGLMLKREQNNEKNRIAIIESEKKFKELIDNSPDLHFRTDSKGSLLYVSSSVHRFTGFTSEELIGRDIKNLLFLSSMESRRFLDQIDIDYSVDNFEMLLKKKDGTTWWGSVSAHCRTDGKRNILGYEGTIRDVTRQRKVNELMVESERMLSIGGLAAGMAHEVNNPLAGLMQSVNVMINRLTNTELQANKDAAEELGLDISKVAQYMEKRGIPRIGETLLESGRRVATVIENLLNYARKQDNSISSNNLIDLVDQTLVLIENDINLKKIYDLNNVDIIKKYPEDSLIINCEREGIQQVLFNIFRNGLQAISERLEKHGGFTPSLVIRISRDSNSNYASIEIEDNGSGMTEETKNRIFDPFFTTKTKDDGPGLGLSVSQFIIREKHGGVLEVQSQPGKGAKFTIKLPFEREKSVNFEID